MTSPPESQLVELGGKFVQMLAQRLDSHETATTCTVERRRGREMCRGTTCSPKPPRLVMLLFGDVARLVDASVCARAVIHIRNCEIPGWPVVPTPVSSRLHLGAHPPRVSTAPALLPSRTSHQSQLGAKAPPPRVPELFRTLSLKASRVSPPAVDSIDGTGWREGGCVEAIDIVH